MVINPKISLLPSRQSTYSVKQAKKNLTITLTITLITPIIALRSFTIQQLTRGNDCIEIGDYWVAIKGIKWITDKDYIFEWGVEKLFAGLGEGEGCSDAGEEAIAEDRRGFDEISELRFWVG